MSCRKIVIDTNLFYTQIKESSYKEKYDVCCEFLDNLRIHCYNKVCYNENIIQEYEKFNRKTKRSKYRTIYNTWYANMVNNGKFEYVEIIDITVNIDDVDDHKFYQTAYNTDDKIFITQEEKLLRKREEILKELGINTLTIEEANKIVIIDNPVND